MPISDRKITKLLKGLSDVDTRKRHMAAEALGEGDERVIYPLIQALKDENPGVQDAAMRSLIRIGGEVTAYMIIPLLRDEPLLRNTALIILKEIGEATVPLLRPLLKDKDHDIRKFALDLIAEIRKCDYPEEIIRLLKEDTNPNVRASAAKVIGLLQYKEALSFLINALNDEEWVCFSALESLSIFKDESTINSIISLLDNSSESIRYAAIDTLGKIGSKEAGKALLEYFNNADEFERETIIKSLIRIGITPSLLESSKILKNILKNGDWDEKMIALKGIAGIKDISAVKDIVDFAGSLDSSEPDDEDKLNFIKDILISMGCNDSLIDVLNDPDIRYRGRKIAVEVLGELGYRKAVPYIINLLGIDYRDVRRAAAKALVDMSDINIGNVLLDAIDDEDGHVRKEAIIALGKIGDKTVFMPLMNCLLKEPYKDVVEEIIKTLLILDAESVYKYLKEFPDSIKEIVARYADDISILIKLSEEKNKDVRTAAIIGLGNYNDEKVFSRLSGALKDSEPEVRKAAVIALGNMNYGYDEIKNALNDTDMWVRVYAVKTLSNSLKQDTVNSLKNMLSDRDIPVILSAIEAIAQLNKEDSFSVLSPLLEHQDEEVRKRVHSIIFGEQAYKEEPVETLKC